MDKVSASNATSSASSPEMVTEYDSSPGLIKTKGVRVSLATFSLIDSMDSPALTWKMGATSTEVS